MAKRTDTKIAILVQVMDELGFYQETITKVSGVPRRTVSDIANRNGYWAAATGKFNEFRESTGSTCESASGTMPRRLAILIARRLRQISQD